MRALVIGRGSMGKRRIRDLTTLGVEVTSWDYTDAGSSWSPLWHPGDLAIISTPPMRKSILAGIAKAKGSPCFLEADVEAIDAPHFPSATSRFTDWYAYLRDLPQTPRAAAYTLHVGQHLEDWHPGADLSTYYAAQRETGACREMVPFELCWLTGLFGGVVHARLIRGAAVGGTAIDAVYQVIVRHENNTIGHILIDALSRPAVRNFALVADGFAKTWALGYEESHYLAEMRAFVAAVKGEQPWPYSQAEEAANLEVLRMIERSD